MEATLSTQLTQQIVETLKTICDHDINFIDIDGGCRAGAKPGLGNGAIFMRLDDMQDFIVPMIVPKSRSIFF